MRSFEKPKPAHAYDPALEIAAIRQYRDTRPGRAIPAPVGRQRLVATWNIANLGQHDRREIDYRVIAEIISWFDIIAVQEVADDLEGLRGVASFLPAAYRVIFNDRAGNNERSAYFYNSERASLGEKIGEIGIVESERDDITLPGVNLAFEGFNRNPFLVSFAVDGAVLLFANAHLYYGSTESEEDEQASIEQRQLEAYAIGRWCDLRRRSKNAYTKHIIAIGDFNLPKAAPGDAIHDALTARGLKIPPHETKIPGTNLGGNKDYDQIAFVPGLKANIRAFNSFDFDGIVFRDIWDEQQPGYWRSCVKYYISDHRPLWALLDLP